MKRTISIVAFAAVMAFAASPSWLYADATRSVQAGIAGGVLSLPEIENLNDRLEAAGYPAFDTGYGTLGGLLRFRFDRLMIGLEGHGFQAETETYGNYNVALSGGYAMIEVGYDVVKIGGFRFLPIIGIGGGSTRLHIYERGDLAFDTLLGDPGRETRINYGSLIVNASVAVEYFARITEKSGLVVGLQAGYNRSIYDRGWMFITERDEDAGEATGGPEVNFNGFAANLNVGWLWEF